MSLSVQSCTKKYFALPVGQIIFIPSRHPGPIRGAFRDRHERWAGMRWTLQARKANAREADGEVVWSGRSDAGGKSRQCFALRGDGGNKPGSPGRARRKPLKPLRREGRIDPVNLW